MEQFLKLAKELESMTPSQICLMAGEMSSSEMRTAKAMLNYAARRILTTVSESQPTRILTGDESVGAEKQKVQQID